MAEVTGGAGDANATLKTKEESTMDETMKKPSGIPSLSKIARPHPVQLQKLPVDIQHAALRDLGDNFMKHTLTDVQEENEEENSNLFKPRSMASSWDKLWDNHHPHLLEAGLHRHSDNNVLTEDTDSFIIGDRIWVSGTKPGQIAYIGETQFAPGEWAGIVLDKPIGKNDGSVAGIRYFQCPSKRGVFSRLTRLTRGPLAGADIDDVSPPHSIRSHSTTPPPTTYNGARRRPSPVSPPPVGSASMRKSPSLCNSNTSLASSHITDFKVGDRVIIKSTQGSKVGTLRYMGTTEFAPGEWCGVELDDPKGKNDGSVEGNRYFECRPNFGLFAPVHKVSRSPLRYRPGTENCAIHSGSGLPPSGLRRAGSKESMNSMSSSMISSGTTPSARRVRLGVNSLSSQKTPTKTTTTFHTRTQTLQDVLREKQLYVEQLLKERDLERAEITRAANQADEAEQKLANLKSEFEQYRFQSEDKLKKYTSLISQFNKEREDLISQLDDEKRKNEDLQFNFEEAAIAKGDIEVTNESMRLKIKELEEQLNIERQKSETDSSRLFEALETLAKSQEEIDHLKTQQGVNQSNENTVLEDSRKQLETAQQEIGNLQRKLTEIESIKNDLQLKTNELIEFKIKYEAMSLVALTQNEEKTQLESELVNLKALLDDKEIEIKNNQLKDAEIKDNLHKDIEKIKIELGEKIHDFQLLMETNNQKENEIESLNSQLNQLKSKIVEFEKNQSDSSEIDQNLKNQIDQLNEKLTAEIAEKERIEKHSISTVKENDNLQIDIEKLKSELGTKTNEFELSTETNNQKENEILSLNSQLNNLKSEIVQLQKSQRDSIETDKNLKNEIDQLNQKLTAEITEKETIEQRFSSISQENENLHKDIEKVKSELGGKLNDFELLSETNNRKEKEIASLNSQLNQLNLQIELLEKNRNDTSEIDQNLKNQIDQLNQMLKTEIEEKETIEQRFISIVKEKDNLLTSANKSIARESQSNEQLQHELTNLKVENERLNSTISETMCKQSQNAEELQQFTKQIQDKNNELGKFVLIVNSLEEQIQFKNNEINLFNQQVESLNKHLEDEKSLKEKQIEEINNLKLSIEETEKNYQTIIESERKNHECVQQEVSKKHLEEINNIQDQLSKKCQALESTLREKQNKEEIILKLSADLDNLRQNTSVLNELQKEMEEKENDGVKKGEEFQKTVNELQQLKHEYEVQNSTLRESSNTISQLEASLEQLQKEVINQQEEKIRNTETITEYNSLIENMKKELNNTVQKLQNLEQNSKEFQLQNSAYKQLLENIQFTENQKTNSIKHLEKISKKENLHVSSDLLNFMKNVKIRPLEESKQVLELQNALKENQKKLMETEILLRNHQSDILNLQDELLKQNNNENGYKNHQQLLEEKKQMEGQVEFLNSIIIDMQRKNKEQQTKIEILESGFSPAAVEELKLYQPGESKVPPRMYCDICEEFDQHETEDCPQQTSEDIPMHSSSDSKKRPPPRPYCDICEEFGHNTEDCKDDQTF